MSLAQGPHRSDAGEARTRGFSVSSQALYHWATARSLLWFKERRISACELAQSSLLLGAFYKNSAAAEVTKSDMYPYQKGNK